MVVPLGQWSHIVPDSASINCHAFGACLRHSGSSQTSWLALSVITHEAEAYLIQQSLNTPCIAWKLKRCALTHRLWQCINTETAQHAMDCGGGTLCEKPLATSIHAAAASMQNALPLPSSVRLLLAALPAPCSQAPVLHDPSSPQFRLAAANFRLPPCSATTTAALLTDWRHCEAVSRHHLVA